MPTACCVIGCKSRGNGQSGVQFFQLPLNKPKILTQWLIVLDRRDWIPKPSSKICSQHFSTDDYVTRANTNVPRLKPDAIPSVFPDLSSSQDEKEMFPIKPKEEPSLSRDNKENNGDVREIKIKKEPLSKISTPIASDSPSGRPRRVSKLNSKMKDFILLDDIKKHKQNAVQSPANKPQTPSDKEKAAQELLSILEDSSSLSGDENSGKSKNTSGNTTKPGSGGFIVCPVPSPRVNSNDGSKDKATGTLVGSSSQKNPTSNTSSSKSVTKPSITSQNSISKLSFDTEIPLPKLVPISRKVASKSTGGQLSLRNGKEKSVVQDGKGSQGNTILAKAERKKSSGSKPKPGNKSEPNRSKKAFPHAFRKTYFQVRKGDKSYYFSYADLNPFVDLTKNNPLYKDRKNSPPLSEDESMDDDNRDDLDGQNDENVDKEEPIHMIDSDEDDDILSHIQEQSNDETSPPTLKRTNKTRQQVKRGSKGLMNITTPSKKESKKGAANRIKDVNEMSSANEELDEGDSATDDAVISDTPVDENSSPVSDNTPLKMILEKGLTSPTMSKVSKNFKITSPVKRKKRFRTVAEIVVRTDNTGQVPSVSIDKINNLVDIETETPPRKKIRRSKTAFIPSGSPDLKNINETVTTKLSEETELDRLSQRITDTIKKMKLLEKVKGNTSKLTVLITTLPPVQEKEILIIKKKNLETNHEQSRELQVAISSYRNADGSMNGSGYVLSPNSNASLPPYVHLDVPILGACNNDTVIEESVTCTVNDEPNSSPQKELPQKENTVTEGSDKNSTPVKPQEGSVLSDEASLVTDEVPTPKEANDPETNASTTDGTGNTEQLETTASDGAKASATTSACEKNDDLNKGIQLEPAVPLQHDHTYMTVISPAVVMTEGDNSGVDQTKDVFSKLKLSDVEISFRTKVSQKIRNLKENVKRKNETINKLKEKIRFLERSVKDERRGRSKQIKPRKAMIETNTLYDNIIDSNELTKSVDYTLNSTDLPLEFEEHLESEEERACSSPITYLCEPAIDIGEKPNAGE